MERNLLSKLLEWKKSPRRKPLILKGIRQVGKTWLLMEFGRLAYDDIAYFNFESDEAIAKRFDQNLDPKRLLIELGVIHGKPIQPEKTLIFFDEIQFCPKALTSLKYFCEQTPEYHIVCAGSLLGIALAKAASFPVGKVDFLTLHPLTFQEFLLANGEEQLVSYLSQLERPEPLPKMFTDKLIAALKNYYMVGGMPEPVSIWLETKDIGSVEASQQAILNSYELDFAKHAPVYDIPKLSLLFNSIPDQLAKENGKFIYGLLKKGARARDYENAMLWLQNAGMVHKVIKIEKPAIPLSAYAQNSYFKLYAPDVGLLRKMAALPAKTILEESRLFQEFKGVLAENFVLQELIATYGENNIYYWKGRNSQEVDFIIQLVDKIIPIEVKASTNVKAKSLISYCEKYQPEVAVETSLNNLHKIGRYLSLPLYMLWMLKEFTEVS